VTVAVVCPDKFRGSLSAGAAAAAIVEGLRRGGVDDAVAIPLADGGEGTLDALIDAVGGSRRTAEVTGPLGEPVVAEWGMLRGGTAVVEMARASGLSLVAGHNDPLRASSRGTGELIGVAAREGARRIIVGVGGSASTDGGLGAIDALGWKLPTIEVTVACDVTTLFLDAARVYGPQKGASPAQVELLTRRLGTLADTYESRTGVDVRAIESAGAAGGLAGGLAALGAILEPGFDVVATAAGFGDALEHATIVVTGEGKLDVTSLVGKVVGGALEWAAEQRIPHRAVIAGHVDDDARTALEAQGVVVLALDERAWEPAESFTRAALLAEEAALELARTFLAR
jgi:glycerate 2-kinase